MAASALAGINSSTMKQDLKWGILGTGRMAQQFARALSQTGHSVLHAVGSRAELTARDFAREFEVPNAFASYQELLDNEETDAVYVATPHSMHEQCMLDSIEAGKAVLCEKPFTLNAGQAERVIRSAKTGNIFLMEAMWTRFLPATRKLRELIRQEAIGEVQVMLAGGAFMPAFDRNHYLFDPELGGGVMLDAGVYLVSMAYMLLGKPVAIKAMAGFGKSGVDEHDLVMLQHGNEALASLYVSLRAQSSPDLTLLGSRGRIHLHPPVFAPAGLTLELYEGGVEQFDLPYRGNGYHYQIDEVHQCLQNNRMQSEIMPLEESLQIMQTMDEIRRQISLVYPQEQNTGSSR